MKWKSKILNVSVMLLAIVSLDCFHCLQHNAELYGWWSIMWQVGRQVSQTGRSTGPLLSSVWYTTQSKQPWRWRGKPGWRCRRLQPPQGCCSCSRMTNLCEQPRIKTFKEGVLPGFVIKYWCNRLDKYWSMKYSIKDTLHCPGHYILITVLQY